MKKQATISVIALILFMPMYLFSQTGGLKSMSLVQFYCNDSYEAGKEQVLHFSFIVEAVDFEYIDSLSLTFPVGFVVKAASDSIQTEYLNPLDANVVSWGDNDNTWGGIPTGEEAQNFEVKVFVPNTFTGKQMVKYYISGDEYGDDPHQLAGSVELNSLECNKNQVPITVNIMTDSYPEETSWYLTNTAGDKILLNGAQLQEPLTLYSSSVCINSLDTVRFVIKDEYSDGICCTNGEGYYTIESPCGVIKQGAMFNDEEDTTFVVKFSKQSDFNFSKINLGSKNDEGIKIFQSCEGGLVMFANNENGSRGGYDFSMHKYNAMGDLEWQKMYGAKMNELVINIAETSDDGFLVAGIMFPQDRAWSKGIVYKIANNGDTLWTATLGEDDAFTSVIDVIECDNNYKVVGRNGIDIILTILSKSGEVLDQIKYPESIESGIDYPTIAKFANNTYLIAFFDEYKDLILKQVDDDGTDLGNLDVPYNDIDMLIYSKVKTDDLFNIYIGGNANNTNDYAKLKIAVLSKNASFDRAMFLDNQTLTHDFLFDFEVLQDKSIAIASSSLYWNDVTETNDSAKTVISKIDTKGKFVWESTLLKSTPISYSKDIISTADGGFAVTGFLYDQRNKEDMFILRTNEKGTVNEVFQHEEICMISVDPVTGKNLIIWEKTPNVGTASYNIYKEGNVAGEFDKIDAVPFNNLSTYIDKNSNPAVKADRYKITCVNGFGLESIESSAHKTMHLSISKGIDKFTYNLIWDHYEGFSLTTYNVYRGTSSDNMVLIASLPSSLTSFTDLQVPQSRNVYYQVAVVKLQACVPTSNLKADSGPFSQSISNMSEAQILISDLDIKEPKQFTVSPNPVSSNFSIHDSMSKSMNIEVLIYSENGQLMNDVMTVTDESIDVAYLKNGIYTVEVRSETSIVREKLIVAK